MNHNFNRLKQCRHGLMLYNVNDVYIGRSLDIYGEFSHFESLFFKQLVRPGDTVIDIGANIGTHTIDLAKFVGANGKVWAFEPQRIVFQTLCANIALNNLLNVHAIDAAACDRDCVLFMPLVDYKLPNNFGGMSLKDRPNATSESVSGVALKHLPISNCRLIKVDVEGMEWPAIKGALPIIEKFRPILYVENDRPNKSAELIRQLDNIGYQMHWHTPPLYNPDNFFKNPKNVFEGIVSANMLCSHKAMNMKINNLEPVQVPAIEDNTPQLPSCLMRV